MSLERFCRKEVVRSPADASVMSVARKMRENHVGAVVIVDRADRPVGIVTDRDIACRLVATGGDAKTAAVDSLMSRELVTVKREGTIDEVAFSMRKHGVRRVPILGPEGELAGMVSLDDLAVLFSAELAATVAALRDNRGP
ncbi:MAG TPA: CBS domain-containing protein [Myxococcales bacterium]|nr:CBS domain-containing protein [Myxococcales bacterium]